MSETLFAQTELQHLIDLSQDSVANKNLIFDPPAFIKGRNALNNFLINNKRYPLFAFQYGIYGTVVTSFLIKPNGDLDSFKVIEGPGFGLNEEALRVLKLTVGKWKPGRINGQHVNTRVTMPIWFNIHNSKSYSAASLDILEKEFEVYKTTNVYKLEQNGDFEEARRLARKLALVGNLKTTEKAVIKTEQEHKELMEKARRSGVLAQALAANDYYNNGITAYEGGKLEEAKALFTTAIELKSDHFPALQNRGVTKYKLQDVKGACADWQQIVKLGGTLPQFLSKLCQ